MNVHVGKVKLKAGDKVRALNSADRQFTKGKVYTVREAGPYSVGIERDDSGSRSNGWGYSNFELVTPTPTIEAGKFYKTRDGRKVGPMVTSDTAHDTGEPTLKAHIDGYCRMFRKGGGAHLFNDTGLDLVAEWVDETPKAEFKVGDRVRFRTGYSSSAAGKTAKVINTDGWGIQVQLEDTPGVLGISTESPGDLEIVTQSTTPSHAIVCLIRDGQPIPATRPHVHATRVAAEKEAARLAGVSQGDEFGVYELVTTKKERKSYGIEWKDLAADGKQIPAIKALRELAGIGLKEAKDIVERWTHDNVNRSSTWAA